MGGALGVWGFLGHRSLGHQRARYRASRAFYHSLGFSVTAETFNHGVEQANLDGVPNPQVEVTALSLAASNPHLELLCYRSGIRLPRRALSSNDVAATRIVLAAEVLRTTTTPRNDIIVDPDGHHLQFAL